MVHVPVLAVPDFSQTFVVETDACDTGIGAVLMHNDHPGAYLSQGWAKITENRTERTGTETERTGTENFG
jgi:hypothetical protein